MEVISRGCLRSKGYHRLNMSGRRKRKLLLVRRLRRMNPAAARRFKLKLRLFTAAKKVFLGLRDAYVDVMLKFATTRVISGAFGGSGIRGFGMRSIREWNERMRL